MAVLRIDWTSMPKLQIHAPVITGTAAEPEKPESSKPAFVKPIIIYIEEMAPSIPQANGFNPINEIVLTENKIVIAAKAFTCVRMTPEKAVNDPFLASVFKDDIGDATASPSMLFVSSDMKVKKLQGDDINVSNVWDEMKALYKKSYKGDLEKLQKSMLKILDELDSVNDAKKLLNTKKEKTEKPTEADRREWSKEELELRAREENALKERDALLNFQQK